MDTYAINNGTTDKNEIKKNIMNKTFGCQYNSENPKHTNLYHNVMT